MSEVDSAQSPPPPPPPPAFAGKYADAAAFENGFRELNKTTGMFDIAADAPLVGEDGVFASHKAMETGYKAMASAMGRGLRATGKSEAASGNSLQIGGSNELSDDADLAAVLKRAGLDPAAVDAVHARDGRLTDDMYTALKKAGLPRKLVDSHLDTTRTAQTLVQEKIRGRAHELAGGEQQLNTLLAFAKSSLPPDRIADLNRRLASAALFEGAIREIAAEHQHAVGAGKATALVGGQAPVSGTMPTNFDDFKKLRDRANRGDQSAITAINAIPMDQFAKICAI